MTKSQLIEKLASQAGMPRTRTEAFVNGFVLALIDAMCRGEKIEIRGFGSFSVRTYASYTGRNPKTSEPVHVRPKRLPFFRVGRELKERINQGAAPAPRKASADAP